MLTIDGSFGEGGGQILRTSLALSLVTGQPFRIVKIRAGRPKPGLLRQHLTAVNAATLISNATVAGDHLGSSELTFTPGRVRPGHYRFDVGSAGSSTLVLQTILPPLLLADSPSRLTITGGTHNPAAPPFDFMEKTFAPILARVGPRLALTLVRPGFYPAGGGEITAEIFPPKSWHPLQLLQRGPLLRRSATAIVSCLPVSIAQRELQRVQQSLGWSADELHTWQVPDARGPGNVLILELHFEQVCEVFTGFGARGLPAETVADRSIAELSCYLNSDAPVGKHLADQLLLPMLLCGGGIFRTTEISSHAQTNLEIIRQFTGADIQMTHEPPRQAESPTATGAWRVTVQPAR